MALRHDVTGQLWHSYRRWPFRVLRLLALLWMLARARHASRGHATPQQRAVKVFAESLNVPPQSHSVACACSQIDGQPRIPRLRERSSVRKQRCCGRISYSEICVRLREQVLPATWPQRVVHALLKGILQLQCYARLVMCAMPRCSAHSCCVLRCPRLLSPDVAGFLWLSVSLHWSRGRSGTAYLSAAAPGD